MQIQPLKIKHRSRTIAGCFAFLTLTTIQAHAALVCQIGVLDLTANGGINPATGQAWKAGDAYHLIYVTTATTQATSSDISTYNAFIQADATTAGMGGVSWFALGSTATVNAIDNVTLTGPVMNAWNSGAIALDAADFWNFQFPANSIHDLNGNLRNAWTGTTGGGVGSGSNQLGTTGTNVRRHWSGWTNWIASSATQNKNDSLYMIGISEQLMVIPEPSTALLLGIGSLALLRRCRK